MADALGVFYLGLRSADQDHDRASELVDLLPLEAKERDKNIRHLNMLLQSKSAAEYEEHLSTEGDARTATQQATRFRRWAQSKLV
jgi:hypothetical protein